MTALYRGLLNSLLLGLAAFPLSAGVITDITFTSNGGSFVNDTITDNGTSPLAFTATTDLNQPFLNAADSTISLTYGNYYAIAFEGFGQHFGEGTVSFVLDDATTYSEDVIFPDPSASSGGFATFILPGNDSVTISATGLSADRISIVADGGGLITDGTADAFYSFNFTQDSSSAAPEPASLALFGAGLFVLFGFHRRSLRVR
jgi:hypothetical protein